MKKLLEQLKAHKKQAVILGGALAGTLCVVLILVLAILPTMPNMDLGDSWNQSTLTAKASSATNSKTDKTSNKDSDKTSAISNTASDAASNNSQTNKSDQTPSSPVASSSTSTSKKESGASTSANTSTSKNTSSSSSQSSSSNNTNTHTHVWQDHVATKQVWVSNMVTVPDYETKTISGGQLYTKHSDGKWYGDGATYWFYTDADFDAFKSLIVEKMRNEGYTGNYVNRTKTEKVQVGSHQEDHGSYQTETYVDYQYCSCGAKK